MAHLTITNPNVYYPGEYQFFKTEICEMSRIGQMSFIDIEDAAYYPMISNLTKVQEQAKQYIFKQLPDCPALQTYFPGVQLDQLRAKLIADYIAQETKALKNPRIVDPGGPRYSATDIDDDEIPPSEILAFLKRFPVTNDKEELAVRYLKGAPMSEREAEFMLARNYDEIKNVKMFVYIEYNTALLNKKRLNPPAWEAFANSVHQFILTIFQAIQKSVDAFCTRLRSNKSTPPTSTGQTNLPVTTFSQATYIKERSRIFREYAQKTLSQEDVANQLFALYKTKPITKMAIYVDHCMVRFIKKLFFCKPEVILINADNYDKRIHEFAYYA